jgi:CRISPR/Cas system CSM-associated protein Csm5 (group 7 of RAMP superfamily)
LPRANQHSQARIQQLQEWYAGIEGGERIASFYHKLSGITLSSNQALLQVGWGAGWDGKTFWTHLQKDARLFEQLVKDFRMDRAGKGHRQSGDRFPKSRRAAMNVKADAQGRQVTHPAAPFGWLLLEMEEKR